MENANKAKTTEDYHPPRTVQKRNSLISTTLSKPEINWLQKEENRTRIDGPGNFWISNKPLWVSDGGRKTRSGDKPNNRGASHQVHKEKKYVVVGMRGAQIQDFHGAYREKNKVTSHNLRRSFSGDRPKPSKPKEE